MKVRQDDCILSMDETCTRVLHVGGGKSCVMFRSRGKKCGSVFYTNTHGRNSALTGSWVALSRSGGQNANACCADIEIDTGPSIHLGAGDGREILFISDSQAFRLCAIIQ